MPYDVYPGQLMHHIVSSNYHNNTQQQHYQSHHQIYLASQLLMTLWYQIPTVYSVVQPSDMLPQYRHLCMRENRCYSSVHSNQLHHCQLRRPIYTSDCELSAFQHQRPCIRQDERRDPPTLPLGTETCRSRGGKSPTWSALVFCTK